MSLDKLKQLQSAGFFGSMDAQIAGLVSRVISNADEANIFAAALASRAVTMGNACADLADFAGKSWADILKSELPEKHDNEEPNEGEDNTAAENLTRLGVLPMEEDWISALDPALFGNGSETDSHRTLFIQKDGRVYLRRYWNYERMVENKLISLNRETGLKVDDKALSGYFKKDDEHQKAAAHRTIANKLSLISGGPGTGKTHTLARAVALLDELNQASGRNFNVRMVAPTGKAAVRMVESVKKAKTELIKEGKSHDQLKAIPEEATTIHRLLESRYHSPYFKHDAKNPLTAGMVIVDEASMVDLPLMAKLLEALPEDCGLMLVGDIDQLASVEPGRVYGDICHAAEKGGPLEGCLTRLIQSYRFPDDSAIGTVSRLVNEGNADAAWTALKDSGASQHLQVSDSTSLGDGKTEFAALVKEKMSDFIKTRDPGSALAAAGDFRILCALRNGPYGVNRMNRLAEKILSETGLRPGRRLYDHQLIMIKVNTPSLKLSNGDVGVVLEKPGDRKTYEVWFPDAERGVRSIPVGLLPDHETAFAMTIHKAQGSEFPYIALILPDAADSPVLTRELIYTGMTRVRIDTGNQNGKLWMWCTEASFKAAVKRKTSRSSGLFH